MIRLSAFSDEAAEDIGSQIAALKRNGIAYTELRSINGKNVRDFTVAEAKEYCPAFAGGGISVWSVGSPLGKVDIGVDFEAYLETVKHVCELANIFKTDKIRMFSFFHAYREKNRVFDYLNRMAETAEAFGVTMYHENEKEIYGDTAERVLEIQANVKALKYIYDPANYIQAGENAGRTLALLHGKTDYFHIKDVISATGELVPAGYGDGEIFSLVDKITDDKVLTVEPHLAVFDGYQSFDNSEMKHKFKFKDNEEAFDCAVSALKKLLIAAEYREIDGAFR